MSFLRVLQRHIGRWQAPEHDAEYAPSVAVQDKRDLRDLVEHRMSGSFRDSGSLAAIENTHWAGCGSMK